MIKKIEIMGLELDNYPYSEALSMMESFLGDTALSPVLHIDTDRLLIAEQDEVVKEVIEEAAFTVITDAQLLTAAGETSQIRLAEVREQDFFSEFMNRIYQLDQSVYLLGISEEQIERCSGLLLKQFPHVRVLGSSVISDRIDDNAGVVNSINISMPDVILSVLESPLQEHFLKAYQKQICAKIWYGLGFDPTQNRKSSSLKKIWKNLVGERMVRSKIQDESSKGERL